MRIPRVIRKPLEKLAFKILSNKKIYGSNIVDGGISKAHLHYEALKPAMGPGFLFIGEGTYLNAEKVVRVEPYDSGDRFVLYTGPTPVYRSQILMEGSSSALELSVLRPSEIMNIWKEANS